MKFKLNSRTTMTVDFDEKGNRDGPFIIECINTQAILQKGIYYSGLLKGEYKSYDENGRLTDISNYDNDGQAHGIQIRHTTKTIAYFSHGNDITRQITSSVQNPRAITDTERTYLKLKWDIDL